MQKTPSNKDIECCTYCPTLCLSRCPVGRTSGNIGLSPQSKQLSIWRIRKHLVEPTIDTLGPAHHCLDCLACREICDHNVNVPASLTAGRIELARQAGHLVPREACRYDEDDAWKRLSGIAPSWRRVDQCQALLVPGLEMLREENTDLLEALFRALDRLGDLVVGVTRDSVLECGHHPYALGHFDLAEAAARKSRKRFQRYSKVLFASPHCASFVRLKWPEVGLFLDKQYTSLLEFLGRRIDFNRAGFYSRKVTYHDPCHFGRHLGLYQIPRDILKWATDSRTVEMLYTRERALCCGGGYPVPEVAPQLADGIAATLMDEAVASGADELIVACAQCRSFLKNLPGGLPVRHLLEVLAEVEP